MPAGEYTETPTICASTYGNTAGSILGNIGQQWQLQCGVDCDTGIMPLKAMLKELQPTQPTQETTMTNSTQRRIVQVFIADPNENVPLEHSILYKGEQKLTDLNDNELFFEIPMAETLKAHNEKRVKWLDKEASKRAGKDILLDAAKIRDLKMLVVTIAAF